MYTYTSFPIPNILHANVYQREQKRQNATPDLEAIEKFLAQVQQCRTLPGLAVGIINDGKIIYKKGFGLRDVVNNLPTTTETLFPIGSNTQAMTAAIAAIFVQKGEPLWEKPIREILTDFQTMDLFTASRSTLLDLLSHRTGIPRNDFLWMFRGRLEKSKSSLTRENLIKALKYLQPSQDFRIEFQFNNIMAAIAGYAVGEVFKRYSNSTCTLDTCWETMIQDLLFNELDMSESLPNYWKLIAKNTTQLNYAKGYVCNDINLSLCKSLQDFTQSPSITEHDGILDTTILTPAIGVWSNINDMTKWLLALLNPDEKIFLSQKSVDRLFAGITSITEAPELMYALGWLSGKYRNNRNVQHSGSVAGHLSLISLFPDTKDGFIIMINHNLGFLSMELIGAYLSDAILDLPASLDIDKVCKITTPDPPRPPILPILVSSSSLDISGNYSHPAYGTMNVYERVQSSKYQYECFWNDNMSSWIRTDADNSFQIQFDTTYTGLLQFTVAFERNMKTKKIDRLKILFQSNVEPIVYVSNTYQPQGYGMDMGFGGSGLAFPIVQSTTSKDCTYQDVSMSEIHIVRAISTIHLVILALLSIFAVVAIIVVYVTRFCMKKRYQSL
jgi:CubicO group peptidase (beta-lactamase class C family)